MALKSEKLRRIHKERLEGHEEKERAAAQIHGVLRVTPNLDIDKSIVPTYDPISHSATPTELGTRLRNPGEVIITTIRRILRT